MAEEYALETKELTRTFGKQKAVSDVSLHVPKGSVYGLVGRNGAGKTTIMKMVTNMMNHTKGEILINGKDDKYTHHEAVGTLIEEPGIMPNLSAYDNLLAKCRLMGVKNPKEQAKELLAALKLEKTGNKKVKNFSLGMRQRVGIALAFCGYPSLVLLDEPINALDPQGILDVRHFILRMKQEKNMTIFISSHLLDELGKVADYFGVIVKGKLVRELSHDDLTELTQTQMRIRVDNKDKAKFVLGGIKGIDKNAISIDKNGWIVLPHDNNLVSDINHELMISGIKVYEISVDHLDTEDFFIRIMGGEDYA